MTQMTQFVYQVSFVSQGESVHGLNFAQRQTDTQTRHLSTEALIEITILNESRLKPSN